MSLSHPASYSPRPLSPHIFPKTQVLYICTRQNDTSTNVQQTASSPPRPAPCCKALSLFAPLQALPEPLNFFSEFAGFLVALFLSCLAFINPSQPLLQLIESTRKKLRSLTKCSNLLRFHIMQGQTPAASSRRVLKQCLIIIECSYLMDDLLQLLLGVAC